MFTYRITRPSIPVTITSRVPETLKIMRVLATRVDRSIGHKVQDDSACRQPQVVKAHHRSVASILARLVKLGKITAMPPRAA